MKKGKPPTIRDIGRYLPRIDTARIKMSCTDLCKAGLLSEDKTGKSPRFSVILEDLEGE